MNEGYRKIREIGFDAVDANLDHLAPSGAVKDKTIFDTFKPGMSDNDAVELFRPWKEAAEKSGIDNYQAHAPFPSRLYDNSDPDYDEYMMDILQKTIRGCEFIDCHNLVIHPFMLKYVMQELPEQEYESNIERYMRLAPVAKEYGVTICLENMFRTDPHKQRKVSAICNQPLEACKYIDDLNSLAGEKVFGFCFDVGHANLCNLDPFEFIHIMGDRIQAFHVHDNNGLVDQHWAPYQGNVNWDRFCMGLKDIGFNKTMSFETFAELQKAKNELMDAQLSYIYACGKLFQKKIAE